MAALPSVPLVRWAFGSSAGRLSRCTGTFAVRIGGGGVKEPQAVIINADSAIDRTLNDFEIFTDDLPVHIFPALIRFQLAKRRLFHFLLSRLARGMGGVYLLLHDSALAHFPSVKPMKIAAQPGSDGQKKTASSKIAQPDQATIPGKYTVFSRPHTRRFTALSSMLR